MVLVADKKIFILGAVGGLLKSKYLDTSSMDGCFQRCVTFTLSQNADQQSLLMIRDEYRTRSPVMRNNQSPGGKSGRGRPRHWGRSLLDHLLLLLHSDRFDQIHREVVVRVLGLHFHVPHLYQGP